MVCRQPIGHCLRVIRGAIQLGAIAGREQRGLMHTASAQEILQGLGEARWIKRHQLAHSQWCRVVIDTKSKELHVDVTLKIAGSLLKTSGKVSNGRHFSAHWQTKAGRQTFACNSSQANYAKMHFLNVTDSGD